MKRTPDEMPLEDYAYYVAQLDLHLDLFKYKAPTNNLQQRQEAMRALEAAMMHIAMLNVAYRRELEAYIKTLTRDHKGEVK